MAGSPKLTADYLTIYGRRFLRQGLVTKWLSPDTPLSHILQRENPHLLGELMNLAPAICLRNIAGALDMLDEEIGGDKDEKVEYNALEQAFLDSFVVATEVETGSLVLWSKEHRAISDWSGAVLKRKFRAKAWARMEKECPLARLTYDPYRPSEAVWEVKENGLPVTVCNEFRPAQWHQGSYNMEEMRQRPESYPEIWVRLVKHLFPVPAHRDIVMDWLALALMDRPISFLSLRGNRGSGKTLFKLMVNHIIGDFFEAQKSVIGDFNYELKNKRLVSCDDNRTIMDRKGHDLRKSLLNPTISYNKKHEQTTESSRQYASLMILSNPIHPFYTEFDERRICSPEMTPHNLVAQPWVAGTQTLNWFREFEKGELESAGHLAVVRQIGESLISRYLRRGPNPDIQLKAGHFWSDVVHSLSSFKNFFLQGLMQDIEDVTFYDFEELKVEYKLNESGGKMPHWRTFSAWAGDFELYDKKIVLSKDVDHDNKSVRVNPAFRDFVLNIKKRRGMG